MKDNSQKVYFARCIGPRGEPIGAYKIGCSCGHNDRLQSLTANLPFTVELRAIAVGGMFMEAACHLALRQHRIAGEYFHECPEVDKFVDRVARTGDAFYRISESADRYDRIGFPTDLITPFMAYHGVTLADACRRMGTTTSRYEKVKSLGKNRKLAAAVALVAAERGQFVSWPADVIRAMQGEHSPALNDAEAA